MIYYDPDDPEAGYFGEDEVWPCDDHPGLCSGVVIIDSDVPNPIHVIPADCSICEREIPEDATVPLCTTCRKTAEAHARQMKAHREWVDDGSPR